MSDTNKAIQNIVRYRSDPISFVKEQFNVEPDEWQKKALIAFVNKEEKIMRICLSACAGPGKLCSALTQVPTPLGFKNHGDLSVGDKIFAEDGTVTKVVATKVWDNIQYYRVKFSDGSFVDCGAQHLWKVQSRHFNKFKDWNIAETQELYDLEPVKVYPGKMSYGGDRKVRRFRIPRQGSVNYPEKDLPIDPYLLGLWLGDGCRNSSCITKDDIEPFIEVEKRGYKVSKYKKFDNSGQRYGISGLKETLKALEISHLYSGERYIPDIYKRASSNQRRELLMGLMDTDGRIKENGMMDFHSTSEKLIDDFVELARSLGQYTHKEREVDTRKDTSDCYSASIRTDFNPFRIKRKGDRWKMPPEWNMYRYIDSIEKLEIGSGKCIEIDHPSHCYLVNDFIVTHNSALLSWCGWLFMSCYGAKNEHPKGAVVSVTKDNLKDNLWAEMSKWQQRSEFLRSQFTWTKERISCNAFPETWFLSARSFAKTADAEEQGRTLSGIHSKFVLFLIDESGDIPTTVLKAAEQALSTSDKEFARVLQAGNPTSHEGMLYAAQTRLAEDWFILKITGDPDNPDRSPRIDIDWAATQIEKYGRDDPWVKSYILGEFPESGINTLLSLEEIDKSMNRTVSADSIKHAQKRLGVDVARFGLDSTVIVPRQGLVMFKYVEMRGARTNDIAARIMNAKAKWGSELEFIDGTGGYGGGVVDSLIQAGQSPYEVHFSGKALDSRYFNKRSEMWFKMADWIKKSGCLYNCPALKKELLSPTYSFKSGKFVLESKDQIKDRLGFSTDRSDALALTFALPDMPARDDPYQILRTDKGKTKAEWDPFKDQ